MEGLGRLAFSAGVLEFYKPFLAPMYAWCSAAPPGAVLWVPHLILFTLDWFVSQLESGRRTTSCKHAPESLGEVFRTDAKGEEDYIVIGGYESRPGLPLSEARWFSLRVEKREAEWLFEKGHSSRTISSSELLATLVAVHLFIEPSTPGVVKTADQISTAIEGVTDNQGNSFVIKKLLSTKMPLMAVVMQLATILASRGVWLNLIWKPREENQLADDLTNSCFEKFNSKKRVAVSLDDIPTDIIARVTFLAKAFTDELDQRKLAKKILGGTVPKRKRRREKIPWG
jgi:hypothetical protein